MTVCGIGYLILGSFFRNKNKRYFTKNVKSIGLLIVHKFSCLKIYIQIFKLANAVYDQKRLIFNQKPINRLALLTGNLRPHDHS